MEAICATCAVCNTARCPYQGKMIPTEVVFGCYRYVKISTPPNQKGESTKCTQCRYFFRKARELSADKSFIMCGAIPSWTRRVTPVPHCPNFKPLRRKQRETRRLK